MYKNNNYEIVFQMDIEDISNDNIDVLVVFNDERRFVATFFTLLNINTILNRYKDSGECNFGKYFWASNMVIVENLSPLLIREAVEDLIKSREFFTIFKEY